MILTGQLVQIPEDLFQVTLTWLAIALSAGNPRQEIVSLSSAKAEYRSFRKPVRELVWLSRVFEELTVSTPKPYVVICDSQSALHIARNLVLHERTKHIEVDCHFVRNKLHEGLVSLHHVATTDQLANVLTKALTGLRHSVVLGKLDVKSTPPT